VALTVVASALNVVLDGNSGWADIAAAAAIVATIVAIAILLGSKQGWVNGSRVSYAALAAIVVGLGSLALVVVTYAGMGDSETNVSASPVSEEGAALTQQVSNNDVQPPGYAHDLGSHPNFENFVSMDEATVLANVPGGTLLPNEVGPLKDQLQQARDFALAHDTIEKAQAAGFFNTTNDVPFMGAHFINREYLMDGKFDPSKPEGLLFSKKGGGESATWQLVGVWFLLVPGVNGGVTNTMPPEGFAGNLDLWHAHRGLCTRTAGISENNTRESCLADDGNFIGDIRWMMHVWVYPEGADNPEGVFTYLNTNLYQMQQNVQAAP
jgi:hypothetical protein